jgi:hypothetical protein
MKDVAESDQGTHRHHCPSRGELLQWYQAYQIRAKTHPNDPQKLQQDHKGMAHVEAIRLRQKTEGLQPITASQTAPVYQDAEGHIVNVSHDEFRNPRVTLSPEDHQRMQRAIQYLQQKNLSTHRQSASRSQAVTQP